MKGGSSTRLFILAGAFAGTLFSLKDPAQAAEEAIRVTYRFPPPRVKQGKDFDLVTVPGLAAWGYPGAPLLPWRPARILLPPGRTVERVSVLPQGPARLPGRHRVAPARGEHSPIDKQAPPALFLDKTLYEAEGPYPPRPWEYHGVGFKHGRALALLSLCPLSYFPRTPEVLHHEAIEGLL